MASLDTAYAQVDRGGEHLAELKRLHDEVCEEQARSTVVKLKRDVGTVGAGETMKFAEVHSPRRPVEIRIRIIAGEAINCFRSALDYLIGQLAILDSGKRQERTQFPITSAPKQFKECRGSSLKGISDAHIAAIEKLQPYNGCGWTQYLAFLSNFAKHDDLILLKHGVLVTTEKLPIDPADPDPFKHRMRVDFENVIQIDLSEGLPVINVLEILKSQVTHTLDAFKPEFK
jgi:hypothetical protein